MRTRREFLRGASAAIAGTGWGVAHAKTAAKSGSAALNAGLRVGCSLPILIAAASLFCHAQSPGGASPLSQATREPVAQPAANTGLLVGCYRWPAWFYRRALGGGLLGTLATPDSQAQKFIDVFEKTEPQRQVVESLTAALNPVAGPLVVLDRSEWGTNVPGSKKFDFEATIRNHNLSSLLVVSVSQALRVFPDSGCRPGLAYFVYLVGPGNKKVWAKAVGYSSIDLYRVLGDPVACNSPDSASVQAFYEKSIPGLSSDLARSYARRFQKK